MKGYRAVAVAGPLIKWMEALFELLVPLVVARLIDSGIPAGISGDMVPIWRDCLILAALGVVGFTCSLIAQYFSAKAATGFAAKLRKSLVIIITKGILDGDDGIFLTQIGKIIR